VLKRVRNALTLEAFDALTNRAAEDLVPVISNRFFSSMTLLQKAVAFRPFQVRSA
jgi:hypothetical protein